MISTTFLAQQNDEIGKSFSRLSVPAISAKRLTPANNFKIFSEVAANTLNINWFRFSEGKVYIERPNRILNLEHISGNVDIVLPKAKQLLDWVVLWYDQDRTIFNVSYEGHSKIKIYGNGSRIMGLDEPLICDMPFMSLRLTFVNEIDGWIVT